MKNVTKKRSPKETKGLYDHIIANLRAIEKDAERAEEAKKAEVTAARVRRTASRAAKRARKEAEEKDFKKKSILGGFSNLNQLLCDEFGSLKNRMEEI